MIIGILHANRKTGSSAPCRVCKQPISVGELHAVVITRYGKAQQAAFKLKATQGQAWTRKAGLKYRRLHLADCLAKWIIVVQHFRSEARRERRGGRPPLPIMNEEERLLRRRLVRRHAEAVRQIVATDDSRRIVEWADRIESIQDKLEVPITPPRKENLHQRKIIAQVNSKVKNARKELDGRP